MLLVMDRFPESAKNFILNLKVEQVFSTHILLTNTLYFERFFVDPKFGFQVIDLLLQKCSLH